MADLSQATFWTICVKKLSQHFPFPNYGFCSMAQENYALCIFPVLLTLYLCLKAFCIIGETASGRPDGWPSYWMTNK